MIIRLDYFFLQNLCLDFILMLAIGKMIQKRLNIIRIFIGCISINICYLVVYMLETFHVPHYYILFLTLLCIQIFGHIYKVKDVKKQILLWRCSILAIFFAGGAVTSVSHWLGNDNISFGYVVIIVILSGALLCKMAVLKDKNTILSSDKECIYEVRFKRGKRMSKGRAFYDTGNQLKSVINGRGIAVLTWNLAKKLLDEQEKEEYLRKRVKKDISGENKIDGFYKIVYETIGEDSGIMPGIMVDEVEIKTEEGNILTKSIMIGISPTSMLKKKKCDCLLPADIFERRNRKAERS